MSDNGKRESFLCHVSSAEDLLVKDASNNPIFCNAERAIVLVSQSISSYKADAVYFMAMLPQVENAMYLALLSIVRLHEIQCHLDLRHALESSVLASYLLHETYFENTYKIDAVGALDLEYDKKLKKSIYKWIEETYPTISEKIKWYKDQINNYSSHSSYTHILKNAEFTSKGVRSCIFDDYNKEYRNIMICFITDIALLILKLFIEANKKKQLLIFGSQVIAKASEIESINAQLKEKYRKAWPINFWE